MIAQSQIRTKHGSSKYVDGFIHPIPQKHLEQYTRIVEKVAEIWKEHGALEYCEFVGEDLHLQGTRSFRDAIPSIDDEVILFGWVAFRSKEDRILVNERVAEDPRMTSLIAPLTDPSRIIFDAQRMVYGGFQSIFHT